MALTLRYAFIATALAAAALIVTSCEFLPRKPEDVFTVYRKLMIEGKLKDARELLSEKSLSLAKSLESNYDLDQSPEAYAVMNIVEPTSPPLIKSSDKTLTVLQVRTTRGGLRLMRLTRKPKEDLWKLDISQELANLQKFLKLREALHKYRGQAGEFAASWKAFSDRLEKMKHLAPPPPPRPAKKESKKSGRAKSRPSKTNRR